MFPYTDVCLYGCHKNSFAGRKMGFPREGYVPTVRFSRPLTGRGLLFFTTSLSFFFFFSRPFPPNPHKSGCSAPHYPPTPCALASHLKPLLRFLRVSSTLNHPTFAPLSHHFLCTPRTRSFPPRRLKNKRIYEFSQYG